MDFGSVTPVLRIFDEAKAREFYVDFLGFTVDWVHRFGDDFPVYMGLSLGQTKLHLSEHHGDVCPGSGIRIETADVTAYQKGLAAKNYRYAKPGAPEKMPWDSLEMRISDPFGNKLAFFQTLPPSS